MGTSRIQRLGGRRETFLIWPMQKVKAKKGVGKRGKCEHLVSPCYNEENVSLNNIRNEIRVHEVGPDS